VQRAQYNRIAFAHERGGIGARSRLETVLLNEHTGYQASRPPFSPGGEPDGWGCRVEPGAEPGAGPVAGAWMKTEAVLSLRLGL
jgi:hypothetical protein